ncbi:MAG: ribonuclease HI family protein [Phycisphaerae bacterium]
MNVTIHIDGGARGNPGPAGAGVTIRDEQGACLFEGGFFLGHMTNNAAEYNALIRALQVARTAGATRLQIFSDSELLVRQVNGDYRVKNAGLKVLFNDAAARLRDFEDWRVRHVRREANDRADELANQAMDAERDVVVRDLPR